MALGGEIVITHAGVLEVESSIEHPTKRTAHFSPEVINVYHGPVINQSGDHNVANVVHNAGVDGQQVAMLLAQIHQIASGLQPAQREEVSELVQVIEGETRSATPRKSMLRTALKGLGEFTKEAAALATPLAQLAQALGLLFG